MRFLPAGFSALLVELADLDETLALSASLAAMPIDGIEEAIPAARTVMIRFKPEKISVEALAGAIAGRDLTARRAATGRLVEIPVRYDGEDLLEVARLTGLEVAEVIRRHTASEFTVAFCGFAPGFGYLVGGDPALHVPRRQSPRTRIPAGAVAIAGVFSGVYPEASPGGWQLIGSTPVKMWDLARDPPALLQPGTRVRFYELAKTAAPGDLLPPSSAAKKLRPRRPREDAPHIKVLAAAIPVLFQDMGRPGLAGMGVSASGTADRRALASANRTVGNPENFPCLEIALGGLSFQTSHRCVIAVTGAPAPISVRSLSGATVEEARGRAVALAPGDVVTIGYPPRGLRSYLAVHGGFDVPPVLGSAARDTLAMIGPEPVTAGTILPLRDSRAAITPPASTKPPAGELPSSSDIVVLDVILGPRADWFTPAAIARLQDQVWKVTPRSSRVGIRLHGEVPLDRLKAAELPSEGTVIGAIQVPHDGQPVLFLADHPLTGGYPVIGVVADYHLDVAGQIPINAGIRFRVIRPFAEVQPEVARKPVTRPKRKS